MSPQSLRLAALWFLYMGALGVFFPFFSLYLHEFAGLDATRAGVVLAAIPAVGLFAPTLWGRLTDATGHPERILAFALAGTAVGHLGLYHATSFAQTFGSTVLLAASATAVVPMTTALSLSTIDTTRFGYVRACGTVGFLVCVLAFPVVAQRMGMEVMFLCCAALAASAAAVAARAPRASAELAPHASPTNTRAILELWESPPIRRFLLVVLLAFLCLQGPMAQFPVFVRARGGDLDAVGNMWLVMLLPEIPMVAFAGKAVERFGARRLLAFGIAAGGLRWILCAGTSHWQAIYAAQALHGAVVVGLLVATPIYLAELLPADRRATGQGLLSMAGLGIGGILSNLLCGAAIDRFGVDATYALSGFGALALALSLPWWLSSGDSSPNSPARSLNP